MYVCSCLCMHAHVNHTMQIASAIVFGMSIYYTPLNILNENQNIHVCDVIHVLYLTVTTTRNMYTR